MCVFVVLTQQTPPSPLFFFNLSLPSSLSSLSAPFSLYSLHVLSLFLSFFSLLATLSALSVTILYSTLATWPPSPVLYLSPLHQSSISPSWLPLPPISLPIPSTPPANPFLLLHYSFQTKTFIPFIAFIYCYLFAIKYFLVSNPYWSLLLVVYVCELRSFVIRICYCFINTTQ